MKRLLLAIAILLGLADVAAAQNVTCATRPVTDNSNACANTAFVNSYVNNPSSPIYSTAHTWTATQTFNTNGTTIPGSVIAGTVLNVAAADSANTRIVLNSYGAGARFTTYARSGTAASPTAVTAALPDIGGLSLFGYDGTIYGSAGAILGYATETWNTGAHGSKVCISTVPNTTTTVTTGLCQENSSGVTIGTPTGGDKGVGTLNIAGSLYANGTAPTGTGAYVRATSPSLVTPDIGAATGTSLALSAWVAAPTVYGGASAGSSLDLRTTSAGSPSGDVLSVRGTTITLRNILNAGVTINLGVAGASGATINIAGSSSGSTALVTAAAASGTLTLPAATDTLVGKATTDTLTNKSMSGASNTFTNIPISSALTGFGSGVLNWLITPSSANLATALTDETGTGLAVFNTSPTFATDIRTPMVIGSTSAGAAALTLKTTTGAGSGDHVYIVGGNNGSYQMADFDPSNAKVTFFSQVQASGSIASFIVTDRGAPTYTGLTAFYLNQNRFSFYSSLFGGGDFWGGDITTGDTTFYSTTNATAYTNGAAIIKGGLGVAKDIWTNGALSIKSWFGTKTPVVYTSSVSVADSDYAIIGNGAGAITLTLPSAASFPGRILIVRTITNQNINSSASNIIPLTGGAATNLIVSNTPGKWAMIQSDGGSTWYTIAGN